MVRWNPLFLFTMTTQIVQTNGAGAYPAEMQPSQFGGHYLPAVMATMSKLSETKAGMVSVKFVSKKAFREANNYTASESNRLYPKYLKAYRLGAAGFLANQMQTGEIRVDGFSMNEQTGSGSVKITHKSKAEKQETVPVAKARKVSGKALQAASTDPVVTAIRALRGLSISDEDIMGNLGLSVLDGEKYDM